MKIQQDDFELATKPASSVQGVVPCAHFNAGPGLPGDAPCIIVVPSVFGFDSTFLLHARRFVDAGMHVYALDSFWRTLPGPLEADDKGMELALGRMGELSDPDCDHDVSLLTDYVRHKHPGSKLVALGICFGGRPVVRAALDGEVDGVAAWHGVRIDSLEERLPSLSCPASLQFGSIDEWTPLDSITQIRQALNTRGDNAPHTEILVHPDCDHGFTHLNRPPVFNQLAYDASMAGLIALTK